MTPQEFAQRARTRAIEDERTRKVWVTQGDEHVCETCNKNEAEGQISFKAVFSSGHDSYPAHDACRCTVLYQWEP